jgi:hypothetical protein
MKIKLATTFRGMKGGFHQKKTIRGQLIRSTTISTRVEINIFGNGLVGSTYYGQSTLKF